MSSNKDLYLKVLFTIVLGTLAVPVALMAQQSGRYSIAGDRISIYNIAGFVRLEAGTGSAVVVDVDLKGDDAEELSVETGPIGSTETLRVIYPDSRIVYPELGRRSRTTFSVRADGTWGSNSRRSDRITVAGSGRGLEAYADLTIAVPPGKSLAIYLGVGEVDVSNVNGELLIDVHGAPVSSRGTRGSLTIETGSGSVDVTDAQGAVNIDTGSGSVEVSDISGPSLLVDTGSGSVTGGNIQVEQLNIDTGSGRIELGTVTSTDVRLDTGSGSVRVDLTMDIEVLDIDTGSGSVTVMIPDDLGAELDIESNSGGIDFELPVTVRRFSRSSLQGTVGDGRGRIKVDTGSGSVSFLRR